jgi:hypothetical protein
VDSLKERHKSYQQKRRFDGIMKLERSESRHNKNMLNVQKKLDERDEKNKEKIFKTYMNFFFARKGREKQLKLKNKDNDHRLQIKAEKIEELEREEEKKTHDLLKKLNGIETRKKEILKHKNDLILSFNKKRKKYMTEAKRKKNNILKDISDNRFDILDYQNELLKRSVEKNNIYTLKKTQINEKTIHDQMNFEKNMKNFYKKLEIIKAENVLRLSLDNRRKIFMKLKKKEAEKKKKEEEDKLLNMM